METQRKEMSNMPNNVRSIAAHICLAIALTFTLFASSSMVFASGSLRSPQIIDVIERKTDETGDRATKGLRIQVKNTNDIPADITISVSTAKNFCCDDSFETMKNVQSGETVTWEAPAYIVTDEPYNLYIKTSCTDTNGERQSQDTNFPGGYTMQR